MTLTQLRYFVHVVTLRSFARAADVLAVTSPALTRRLNNLEAQLGVRLLERSTRSVALTEAGAGFLPRARYLLDELTTTFREIRAGARAQRGTVTIAWGRLSASTRLPSASTKSANGRWRRRREWRGSASRTSERLEKRTA